MASFPGLCKAVVPAEEEDGELDGSLQQMLKAIADERNRLNIRQEISGLGIYSLWHRVGAPAHMTYHLYLITLSSSLIKHVGINNASSSLCLSSLW